MSAPPPPPFGLVLPSRPVLTDPQVISPTQYAFTVPAAPLFSHLVIFLLPGVTLPENTVAGVYIQYPPAIPDFKLLGAIGNDKPSAIFQLHGLAKSLSSSADPVAAAGAGNLPVTVGLSVESAATIAPQLEALASSSSSSSASRSGNLNGNNIAAGLSTSLVPASSSSPSSSPLSTKVLAQRIIKNAFNFLASFAGSTTVGGGGQEVVPLKSFQDWWAKFERRVELDPGFLEREDDGG